MKVYKGTDKDMKCCGFQYKLGEKVTSDDAIRCGDKGYHSCKAPMDVLRYYPFCNGNRYFEAEADGKIDEAANSDSKLASSELTLKAEIGLKGLIEAQVEYTRKKAETGNKGGYRSNLAGGDRSNLAGGDGSNLAGGYGSNLAGGDCSLIVGRNMCKAKGGLNSVVVVTEWEWKGLDYLPVAVQALVVDGDKIKPNVWYQMKDGKIVEVEE